MFWQNAIDAAIKQHEQDKEDAVSYRWLRKQHNSSIPSWHVRSSTNSIPLDLDIGLDAAMAKESGNG
jgi:hypothetical protein